MSSCSAWHDTFYGIPYEEQIIEKKDLYDDVLLKLPTLSRFEESRIREHIYYDDEGERITYYSDKEVDDLLKAIRFEYEKEILVSFPEKLQKAKDRLMELSFTKAYGLSIHFYESRIGIKVLNPENELEVFKYMYSLKTDTWTLESTDVVDKKTSILYKVTPLVDIDFQNVAKIHNKVMEPYTYGTLILYMYPQQDVYYVINRLKYNYEGERIE